MRRPFMEIYPHHNRQELSDYLDQYAPGFQEAEAVGNGLAIEYDLERILADEGAALKIVEG